MKHVQVCDLLVVLPCQRFFEFSHNDYSFTILADDLTSVFDVLRRYLGIIPASIKEVRKPSTSYLFLLCDYNILGLESTGLCRVPLRSPYYYISIRDYFRFNISDNISVLFE